MPKYSIKKIRSLLAAADSAPTADAKGDYIEELVGYLFSCCPGISLHGRNIIDAVHAHEIDLAFWHIRTRSPIAFLDDVLIVECKHTAQPIGSSEVNWFIQKLRVRGVGHGILVSLGGITGAATGTASAHSEILNALTADGLKILLIDRSEIEALRSTADLAELLKRKVLKLVLERAVS
jgi:hypothetical protein